MGAKSSSIQRRHSDYGQRTSSARSQVKKTLTKIVRSSKIHTDEIPDQYTREALDFASVSRFTYLVEQDEIQLSFVGLECGLKGLHDSRTVSLREIICFMYL